MGGFSLHTVRVDRLQGCAWEFAPCSGRPHRPGRAPTCEQGGGGPWNWSRPMPRRGPRHRQPGPFLWLPGALAARSRLVFYVQRIRPRRFSPSFAPRSGRSVARYRAWFGTRRSSVRIWPPRQDEGSTDGWPFVMRSCRRGLGKDGASRGPLSAESAHRGGVCALRPSARARCAPLQAPGPVAQLDRAPAF